MADGKLWITSAEASEIMTETHGRPISQAQVRQLGRRGTIRTRPLHARTNLYNRNDVIKAHIKQHDFSRAPVKGRPTKGEEKQDDESEPFLLASRSA